MPITYEICGELAGARYSIRRLLGDEDGATAVEYEIIVAGISISIIAVVSAVGENVFMVFVTIADALSG